MKTAPMKTARGIFVTGTDTEVGKTFVSCALLAMLKRQGVKAAAMKPVASGAEEVDGRWCNDDARRLQAAAGVNADLSLINPYVFPDPVAPHIAAARAGAGIDFARIRQCFSRLEEDADFVLVEGVGGWLVPLNERQSVADLARELDLPVLLVVGMRLGCINHALLTAQAIAQAGLKLRGWVANRLQGDYPVVEDNIAAIAQRIGAPLLASVARHERGSLPRLDFPL